MPYILALLLLIMPTLVSGQNAGQSAGQSDKTSAARHDAKHKKNMPPPAAPVASKSQADEPTFQYNQTYSGETNKPVHNWIDFLNAFSTLAVGIATVVMVVVAWKQNQATRRAERAWIVADMPDPPTINQTGAAEIFWILPNNGRTPAWVTELGSGYSIVRDGEELPEKPQYRMAGPFPPEGMVLTPTGRIERGISIPAEQMALVEQGQHTLYVFGIVKYRDIFGGNQEMAYCFRFKTGPTPGDPAPRGFYVGGPRGYSRAT